MITKILIVNALVLFVYMSLFFIAAKARKRIDTVDISWGLGFVAVAWSTLLLQQTNRSLLITVLVTIWGLRLANHIYKRSKTKGEDPRYAEISSKWKGNFWLRAYLSIFLLQGGLILVVSLPISLAANTQLDGLGWLSVLGAAIWLKGFIIEAVADKQLANFLKTKNHPKLLQTGLWHYSRHPNYYGEIVQWWGIGVIALQTSYGWIGLIGPITITILIVFISGIPPIERRKANDKEYQDYKRRTSPFFLLPPRK